MAKKDKKKAEEKLAKKARKAAKALAKKSEKKAPKVEDAKPVEQVVEVEQQETPAAKPALSLAPVTPGEPWKTVSIKIPVSRVEAVDKAAKEYGGEGVSRSEFIRMALEEFLAK